MRLLSVVSEETWSAIRDGCAARGVDAGLVACLVQARLRFAGAGNRRNLFAEFDRLLDAAGEAGDVLALPPALRPRGRSKGAAVQLRSLSVRNWKVFRRVEVHCPEHDPERPIVLLGGKNGSGKTSLLQALLFGLYGRWVPAEGFRDATGSSAHRRGAYRKAIESAFHRRARSEGEPVMSVTLAFDTAEGRLQIDRRWFFGPDGSFVDEDEEVVLQVGEEGDVLSVPAGIDPHEFYQDEIARRLLPPALAPFFFFDGEQVKRLGERRLSEQVRLGVESLLGAHVLRDAVSDLRDYARDRARDAGVETLESEDRRAREIARLEERERTILERLGTLEAELFPMRARRDALIGELGGMAAGSFADLQEILERRKRNEGAQVHLRQAINAFAAEELPLVLAGRRLREALAHRLRQEEAAEVRSQFGSRHQDALEAFIRAFSEQDPPLDEVEPSLAARIRAAWQAWSGPEGPEELRHHYLAGRSRAGVLDRLSRAGAEHESQALAIIRDLSRAVEEHAALTGLVEQHRNRSERRERLAGELDGLSVTIEARDSERRQLDRDLGELRSTLFPRREEDQLRRRRQEAAVPALRRAALSLRVAEGVEKTIGAVVPAYFEVLAREATRSYRALAHKDMVQRIHIEPDGEVVLLDRAGSPVQDLDASAGERHVFAMALMAAVADLAGCALPVVMDTPLGRLDSEHRDRILSFFSAGKNQTILLAQPDEIHGRYLAQIEPRIATSYHLDHEAGADGPGESIVNEGYFPLATV